MNKAAGIVAAVVVVGAVAWTGGAWYTGQRVEQEVHGYVARLDQQPAYSGVLRIAAYERGVFSSEVRYVLDLEKLAMLPDTSGLPDEITLHDHIQHGPFTLDRLGAAQFAPVLATTRTRLENTAATQPWFAAAEGSEPIESRAVIGYDNQILYRVDLAPLSVTRDGLSVNTSAGHFSGTVSADLQTVTGRAEMADVRLQTLVPDPADPSSAPVPVQARMLNLDMDADYRRGRFGFYVGEGKLGMERLSVETPSESGQPLTVTLNGYALSTLLTEDEKNLSGHIEYGVGNLQVAEADLGRLDAILRFGNLDGRAVEEISRRYHAIAPQLMAEINAMPPDADDMPPKTQAFLEESLAMLLPGKPTFGLDPLRWTLPEGESSLRLNTALQPMTEDAGPAFFGPVASLDATLVVSRPMVIEMVKRMSRLQNGAVASGPELDAAAEAGFAFIRQMALASGYVVEEGGNLVARLSYADGQARLNGEQVPLEDLLDDMPL